MNANITLNGVADGLEVETVTSLAEFADEPGGAWAPGWYQAEVIEGYLTGKGKEFRTEDSPSSKGDSRNLRLCLKVSNGGNDRNMQESFNYRTSDFTSERLGFIKEMRQEFKGLKGAWPDRDAQRSSLAIAKLGQIEKATSKQFRLSSDGLIAHDFVGIRVDVRLAIDENGYNTITAFAPAASKTKRS